MALPRHYTIVTFTELQPDLFQLHKLHQTTSHAKLRLSVSASVPVCRTRVWYRTEEDRRDLAFGAISLKSA